MKETDILLEDTKGSFVTPEASYTALEYGVLSFFFPSLDINSQTKFYLGQRRKRTRTIRRGIRAASKQGTLPNQPSPTTDLIDRRLAGFLRREGIELQFKALRNLYGQYSPRKGVISIDETLAGIPRTQTLTHEVAHYLGNSVYMSEYEDTREETIVESSAYVTLMNFNIDTSQDSFPYVARYLNLLRTNYHIQPQFQVVANRAEVLAITDKLTGIIRG